MKPHINTIIYTLLLFTISASVPSHALYQTPYPIAKTSNYFAQSLPDVKYRIDLLTGIKTTTNNSSLNKKNKFCASISDADNFPKEITIPCSDGSIMVPRLILQKCHIFKDSITDFVADQSSEFAFDIIKKYPKKILTDLFLCVANPEYSEKLSYTDYDHILEAAAYFGIPYATFVNLCELRKLKQKRQKVIPYETLNITELSDTPILNLPGKIARVDLNKKGLSSLNGIETAANGENVTHLNLKNNKITILNIQKLAEKFPKLQWLDVSYNDLKEVDLTHLPNNLNLVLSNNKIETIKMASDKFIFLNNAPENSSVTLKGNKLSAKELAKLQLAFNPSFWQKNREKFAKKIKAVLIATQHPINIIHNEIFNNPTYFLYLGWYLHNYGTIPNFSDLIGHAVTPHILSTLLGKSSNVIANIANTLFPANVQSIMTIVGVMNLFIYNYYRWTTLPTLISKFIHPYTQYDFYANLQNALPKMDPHLGQDYRNAMILFSIAPFLYFPLHNWDATKLAFKPSKIDASTQKIKKIIKEKNTYDKLD